MSINNFSFLMIYVFFHCTSYKTFVTHSWPSAFTGLYDVNQDLFLWKKRIRNGGNAEAANERQTFSTISVKPMDGWSILFLSLQAQ